MLGDSKGQNWQHIYTAVTRGRKRVYVVGREADIERGIQKMIIPRTTRLRNLVKEVVSPPGPEGEDTLTQSGLSQSPVGPSQILGFEPTQSSTTATEFVSELSHHDGDAALMGTISSFPGESSRPSKRPGQAEDCTTPIKLAKVT